MRTSFLERHGLASSRPVTAVYRLLMPALLTAIAFADYATRDHVAVSAFYAMVAMVAGWTHGRRGALAIAVACTVLHFATQVALHGPFTPMNWIDQVVRSGAWLLIGLGAAEARRRYDATTRQRQALAAANLRMTEDLELARRVQSALLFKPLPSDPRAQVSVQYSMARGVGGDFHDVHQDGDRLAVCVADVSGKGASAALVTALLRGVLEEVRARPLSPGALMGELNRSIQPFLPDAMFITCFYGELDLASGRLCYASAGHDPPFLRGTDGQVEELERTGMPLGIMADESYGERSLSLHPLDTLVLYSDGLPNLPLREGGRLGEEALRAAVAAAPVESAVLLAMRLLTLSSSFEEGLQDDDVVLIVLRYTP